MGHSTARLIWCGKGLYVGIDSGKHSLVVSTQDEANNMGMKPADLLTYRVKGETLTEEGVGQAIQLAEGKYCSVSASLKPQVNVTTSFQILNDSG